MTPASQALQRAENDAILVGRPTDAELTTQLLAPTWRRMGRTYWILLGIASGGTLMLFALAGYTILVGIGVWGNSIPVAWGFGIINFVWWIGIGHAGTFISAILFLLEQRWRTSINRFTEAMTLFAVVQAGMFPVLHMGRPWFAYWLFPYPATMGVWPQLRSALPWDAAAVSTYFITSLLFWFLGLVPDFAALRDRAPSRVARIVYGILAMGWRGSGRHYRHYRMAYLLLAGVATPLVLSVHSVVSLDFAITNLPGWHTTILPPFFVAGAIYSGFAMVLTWIIPARRIFRLENVITMRHIDNLAKVMFVTGWVVTYSYAIEIFTGWFSGDPFEHWTTFHGRPLAHGSIIFWLQMLCNAVIPQLLWSRRVRHNLGLLVIISLAINVGMWSERFVIIVLSLQQGLLAIELGRLHADLGRPRDPLRHDLLLLSPVSAVPSVLSLHSPVGNEGDEGRIRARGRAALSNAVVKGPYGLLAEFETGPAMVAAVVRLRELGYTELDTHSPYPVEGAEEALGLPRSRVMLWALVAGLVGGGGAYTLEWWISAVSFPFNVGGRPLHSGPAFIPISFEMTVLFAALTAFLAVFIMSGLPRL